MAIEEQIIEALKISFFMFWEVLWPLILGFTISGIVQAVVSHKTLAKLLGKDSLKSHMTASLLGTASSSCSYAAIALSRSIFQKGASFTNAMIFELSSTNLVIELGLILFFVMGWQFAVAELSGGILMVILLALLFRFTLTKKLVSEAKARAKKGLQGRMEGHAAMDMSIEGKKGSFWSKLCSSQGTIAVSRFFIMDWVSIWTDLVLGFLIAGFLAAFIPHSFWQSFFFSDNNTVSFLTGPLIGPFIAIISFVCSVGNVPLAAVLWNNGMSFGGVVSFIFADLIILPILNIYRKYYGFKAATYIFVTFYFIMAIAGYVVEFLFTFLQIIPISRNVTILEQGFSWNYTTFLNIGFLILAGVLIWRFLKTGGSEMVKMMNKDTEEIEYLP